MPSIKPAETPHLAFNIYDLLYLVIRHSPMDYFMPLQLEK